MKGQKLPPIDSIEELAKFWDTAEPSKIHWIEADIPTWSPDEAPDLIYSNATLHWVEEHQKLFPCLGGCLKAGGCLAVQMPLSWEAPSHWLMRETLANGGPNGEALGTETLRHAVTRKWVEEAEVYYDLLVSRTRSLDIWETTSCRYWKVTIPCSNG